MSIFFLPALIYNMIQIQAKQVDLVKVMLHETIRNDDFQPKTALQHCCDIVLNVYNIVPALQRCVALKVDVCESSSVTSPLGSFSNHDSGDDNENVKKAMGLLSKTITLHVLKSPISNWSSDNVRRKLTACLSKSYLPLRHDGWTKQILKTSILKLKICIVIKEIKWLFLYMPIKFSGLSDLF